MEAVDIIKEITESLKEEQLEQLLISDYLKYDLSREQIREAIRAVEEDRERNIKEYLEVLDEKTGRWTGRIKRRDIVHEEGDWHGAVHVIAIDQCGRMAVQIKRDGRRDISVGGHAKVGKKPKQAAKQEATEGKDAELWQPSVCGAPDFDESRLRKQGNKHGFRKIGRKDMQEEYEYLGEYHGPSSEPFNREFCTLFLYLLSEEEKHAIEKQKGGECATQSGEVKEVKFVKLEDALEDCKKDPANYASGFKQYYQILLCLADVFKWVKQGKLTLWSTCSRPDSPPSECPDEDKLAQATFLRGARPCRAQHQSA